MARTGLTGERGAGRSRASGAEAMAFLDIDDTIREVHGYATQGAAFGYSGVKGVNAQVETLSCPTCALVMPRPGCVRATPPAGTARPA